MAKSAMERLRSGESIEILLLSGESDYSVKVDSKGVWIFGCDCASTTNLDEVKQIHEALGAWLRIQKGKSDD